MSWLQPDPSGNFHISFRFGGRKFKRSLRTKSKREAAARLHRLDENIRLVECGRLELPESGDIAQFLLSDGQIGKPIRIRASLALGQAFKMYFDALPDGALEENTVGMLQIHRRHLERKFGKTFKLTTLRQPDLQNYIAKRSKEKGIRGRKLSATTIRKEVTTLRSIWNWASAAGHLDGEFPNRGLKYPKITEKPPFRTWEQITTKIKSDNPSANQQRDLWDCLFLSSDQIVELLAYVREHAPYKYIYPMFVMAAHTGARRSELLRSHVSDFDGEFVTIRERKRVRGRHSTRRVPISPELAITIAELRKWHPGGALTFCSDTLPRSFKQATGPVVLSASKAQKDFEKTLQDSKWSVLPGWHCLRHSFCSNCALKGIDQRIIDSWVGHTTDAMRQRYRHLFPNHETEALRLVFG